MVGELFLGSSGFGSGRFVCLLRLSLCDFLLGHCLGYCCHNSFSFCLGNIKGSYDHLVGSCGHSLIFGVKVKSLVYLCFFGAFGDIGFLLQYLIMCGIRKNIY